MDEAAQDCRTVVFGNRSTEFWAANLYMCVDSYRTRDIQGHCSCFRLSAEFEDDHRSRNKGFVYIFYIHDFPLIEYYSHRSWRRHLLGYIRGSYNCRSRTRAGRNIHMGNFESFAAVPPYPAHTNGSACSRRRFRWSYNRCCCRSYRIPRHQTNCLGLCR